MKRKDYINWNDYFMYVAQLVALRSKDPSTQAGAVLVKDYKIIGTGYNGFPNGCSDSIFPWERDEDFLKSKTTYVIHAEVNGIINSNFNMLEGSSMFCTLFPCNECAKIIIQVGIKYVNFFSDLNPNYKESFEATCKMFNASGVKYLQYIPDKKIKLE